jgi:hypothetical protein
MGMSEITIADRIRGRSVERHIKTSDWAKLFKVTARTWQYWLREPEKITIGQLRVIAARLDTSVAALLGEADEKRNG